MHVGRCSTPTEASTHSVRNFIILGTIMTTKRTDTFRKLTGVTPPSTLAHMKLASTLNVNNDHGFFTSGLVQSAARSERCRFHVLSSLGTLLIARSGLITEHDRTGTISMSVPVTATFNGHNPKNCKALAPGDHAVTSLHPQHTWLSLPSRWHQP